MSRRSAVESRSVSQPQVDETEIMGDRVEITGDSRVLFLLAQTCCDGPVDVHTARDRLERIKWRQTVPCRAHVLKRPKSATQPTHLTPPAVKHISGPSESYWMVRRSILDPIFILDHDFEVPGTSGARPGPILKLRPNVPNFMNRGSDGGPTRFLGGAAQPSAVPQLWVQEARPAVQ